jgi:hypothetical protein
MGRAVAVLRYAQRSREAPRDCFPRDRYLRRRKEKLADGGRRVADVENEMATMIFAFCEALVGDRRGCLGDLILRMSLKRGSLWGFVRKGGAKPNIVRLWTYLVPDAQTSLHFHTNYNTNIYFIVYFRRYCQLINSQCFLLLSPRFACFWCSLCCCGREPIHASRPVSSRSLQPNGSLRDATRCIKELLKFMILHFYASWSDSQLNSLQ